MLKTTPEEIHDLIINFQKQQIWRDKRFDFVTQWLEIEHVDRELEKHIQDQNQRTAIQESIDSLTTMFAQDRKVQDSKAVSNRQVFRLGLAEVIKRQMDTEKFEEDKRSEMAVRFQRTMRRLIVLRSFARVVGLEFDVDQLDIATLTRRHGSAKGKKDWAAARVPNEVRELLSKQDHLTSILNYLRFEVFFEEEDLEDVMNMGKRLSSDLTDNSIAFKQLNNFVFNADWKDLLKNNKRLARKLLDAIKLYQRPGVQAEKQEKTDINVEIRKKILEFHKARTKRKEVPAASLRRLSTLIKPGFTKL